MEKIQATLASANSQIQALMRTTEHHASQVERATPAIAENERLKESVKALEKMLADAHSDKKAVQARVKQLESENLALTDQLSMAEAKLTTVFEELSTVGPNSPLSPNGEMHPNPLLRANRALLASRSRSIPMAPRKNTRKDRDVYVLDPPSLDWPTSVEGSRRPRGTTEMAVVMGGGRPSEPADEEEEVAAFRCRRGLRSDKQLVQEGLANKKRKRRPASSSQP
ncbi:unnamed protein product [Miscanthus lutarioriparius]|uniref:Uncharacterized protein n=1 Tax=Miscanthus lutarioriparius TaxID=422564 RepID=A0A811RRD5_9POAL|nr:unnamed protein product [Miscanthus lutarioriparius]